MFWNRRLKQARQDARLRWSKSTRFDRFLLLAVSVYILCVTAYFVWHHNFFSPDQFFFLALVVSVLVGRVRAFLWDWVPLIALLFGYEYVRGLVPLMNDTVYIQPMIDFDRFVFGRLPTLTLQERFYTPGVAHWYDYAAVSLYLMHFLVPLAVGFLFWLRDRRIFKEYAAGMLILSYLAYLTYLIFPAAPPWMAAAVGSLPPVTKILDVTLGQYHGDPVYVPTLYHRLGVNMVAAVPSLHAAFPLLVSLFVWEKAPRLLPLLALYVFGVWLAIVYLGEHYVFDAVTGVLYAVAAYALVIYWPSIRSRIFRRKKSSAEAAKAV